MKINKPASIELQTIGSSSTGSNPSPVQSQRPTSRQPAVQDIERDAMQTPRSTLSALKPSKKAIKIGIAALGVAATGATIAYSVRDAVNQKNQASLERFSKNKQQYCAQFSQFSWITPNHIGAKPFGGAEGLNSDIVGIFNDFHSQPQDVTSSCVSLFNSSKVLFNPHPTGIAALDQFGPFPGTNKWYILQGEYSSMPSNNSDLVVWGKPVSDFNPKA